MTNTARACLSIRYCRGQAENSNVQGRETAMKVRVEDTCTACGLCVDTCPEVFELGDEYAEVLVQEVPAEHEEDVQQAADECPVEAIVVE
jgi:ferredoxin